MNIDRRQLILSALAFGLLSVAGVSVVPALAASADEEAVAKNVEAFRAAQAVGNAEALAGLCRPNSATALQRGSRRQGVSPGGRHQRKIQMDVACIQETH